MIIPWRNGNNLDIYVFLSFSYVHVSLIGSVTIANGQTEWSICIPLIIYISNRLELVQTYQRGNVQQMTHVIFCKLLFGGFSLGESESVYNCVSEIPS